MYDNLNPLVIRNKLSLVGMQLPEKYKENFDVSSEGPSNSRLALPTLTETAQDYLSEPFFIRTLLVLLCEKVKHAFVQHAFIVI